MTVCKARKHHGIFGTPEEPLFHTPSYRDFPQILQESLINMASQNESDMQLANSKQGFFRQGAAANLLFLVCERLQLTYQVKFIGIELFDRFMQKHLEELYNHVYSSTCLVSEKQADWQSIVERVQKQLYLRIVSCCQIASKLTSHYKVISVSKAKRFLLEMGQNYTANSILQSELRVLKTLDFQVAILTPLDYVETILQVLAHNTSAQELPISVYQSVSVQLLTVLHLRCLHVYRRLLSMGSCASSRYSLKEAQADKLLMATAVIAAATYISNQEHTDVVIEHLCRISQIPCEDIEDFVAALIREIQLSADR